MDFDSVVASSAPTQSQTTPPQGGFDALVAASSQKTDFDTGVTNGSALANVPAKPDDGVGAGLGGDQPAASSSFSDFLNGAKQPFAPILNDTLEQAKATATQTGEAMSEPMNNPAVADWSQHPIMGPVDAAVRGVGKVGNAIGGTFGFLSSPVTGAIQASVEPLVKPAAEAMQPFVGGNLANVTPKAIVEQEATIKPPPPILDSEYTSQNQQEALAQLSMSARQPWTKTPEQAQNILDNTKLPRSADEIQAQINQVAQDTSRIGAKYTLNKLQDELAEAKNPQLTVDRIATSNPELTGGKLAEEQVQTNIIEPAQKALDSGVPVDRVRAELDGSIPKHFDDDYRQELIDRAIPPAARNVADASPTVAKAIGIPEEVVQNIVLPKDSGIQDTTSPNVVKDAMGLNAAQTEKVLSKNINWTKIVNKFAPLENLNRSYAELNGIDIGRPDLLARSPTAFMRNIDERENGMGLSYVGMQDGSSMGVYEIVPGQSQLKINPDVMPQTTIEKTAINMGAQQEILTKADSMFNAADNYANKDRVAQETIKDIQAHRQSIAGLQAELAKAENKGMAQQEFLQNQVRSLAADIATKEKLVKSLGEAKTYASREEVTEFLNQYKDNPAVQFYIDQRSKLNESALRNLVSGGKITQDGFDRMRAANPHYTPAWREADDFTFDLPQGPNRRSIADAFKRRDMSEKGAEQIDFRGNNVRYFLSTAKKAQDAQVRGAMFQNLLNVLGDDGWQYAFREPKADVLKALERLKNEPNTEKLYSTDVTPVDPKKFEYYDTVAFPVNGKQIQLSVKDPNLFTVVSNAYSNPDTVTTLLKPLRTMSQIKVGLLTKYNPAFNIRNVERAFVDHNFNTMDGQIFRNYIPGASQLKIAAQMVYNPKVYEQFRREYGLTDPILRQYKGMSVDEIVNKIKTGKQPNTVLSGIDNVLSGFADRGDALTRMLEYKLTYTKAMKDGLTDPQAKDAALIAAKNIHLNFSQRGASGNFNAIVGVFPFGRAFLNAVDKTTRYGIYAPKAMASGALSIYVLYKGLQTWNNQYKGPDGQPVDNHVDERIADQYWWVRTGPNVNDITRIPNGWFGGHLGRPMNMTIALLANKTGQFMDKALNNQSNELTKQAQKMFPEVDKRLTGEELFEAWSNATTKLLTPDSFLPVGIGSIYGASHNQDTQGHPIVPQQKDGTPASLDYFAGSTDYAVAGMTRELAAKGYEVSPGMLQYYVREMGGAAGEISLVAGAHIFGLMSGKNYPLPERGEIPGFSLVSGNTSNVPHTGVEAQYYNMQQKVAPIETQALAYEKAAKQYPEYAPIYQKFVTDHANELHWAEQFKANNAQLNQMKALTSRIAGADKDTLHGNQENNPSVLGDAKKRESIDNLRIQMQDRMQNTIDSVRRDMDNGNSYAGELWINRHTNSPLTEQLKHLIPNKDTTTPSSIPDVWGDQQKSLDKSGKTSYNILDRLNPISDAQAMELPPSNRDQVEFKPNMLDHFPPAQVQEASPELQEQYKPGFMEKYLPTLRQKAIGMYRDNIVDYTIKQEGGDKFTQTPNDRGGATKFGITLKTLQEDNPKATADDVKNLTESQARDIYVKKYWDKGQVDKMPIGVQDLVFDMNVNHGLGGSGIIIQRALNDLGADVDVDGRIGNNTLNAMNDFKAADLRAAMLKERQTWVENIAKEDPSQAKFLPGWKKRIADLQTIPEDVKQAEA